jgi:hypothetical protein
LIPGHHGNTLSLCSIVFGSVGIKLGLLSLALCLLYIT